jgi:hypothetical protein
MPTLDTIQGFVDIMRGYHVEGFKDTDGKDAVIDNVHNAY